MCDCKETTVIGAVNKKGFIISYFDGEDGWGSHDFALAYCVTARAMKKMLELKKKGMLPKGATDVALFGAYPT